MYYIRNSKANGGFGKICMLMFFFFNDDKLKETLEAKETNREIEVSAEEEPCEIVKNIFNEPHPTDSPAG